MRFTIRATTSLALAALLALVALSAACSPARAPQAATPPSASAGAAPSATLPASAPSSPTTAAPMNTGSEGGAIGVPVTVTPGTKPTIGPIPRPSDAVAIEHAKKLLVSDQGVSATNISVQGATQDKAGHWWILLSVTDPAAGPAKLVLKFNGKKWDDPIYGITVTSTDLPPDVKF